MTTVCPSEMMGCCRSHDSSSYPYYSTLFLAFSFYEMCRYIVYIMYIDTILRVYIYNMCMYLRVYNDNCVYIYIHIHIHNHTYAILCRQNMSNICSWLLEIRAQPSYVDVDASCWTPGGTDVAIVYV